LTDVGFVYSPSPQILQWLAAGQLANRFGRSLRLWVLLRGFYHPDSRWRDLPQPFSYAEVRSHLFAPTHPQSNQLSVEELVATCHDSRCICHQPFRDWIFTPETLQEESVWRQIVMQLTGLSEDELEQKLQERPFATVHRSIRDDLKYLQQMGWLKSPSLGKYQLCSIQQLPTPPTEVNPQSDLALSKAQIWELLRVLESVAFVQPNLNVVLESLWQQATNDSSATLKLNPEPTQRIFIHLDYILCEEMQEQVDTYQEQLESLWRRHEGGVVRFLYWLVAEERQLEIITYPVCLHYMRRAKYVSAYGIDPHGNFGWHNYRLDRIAAKSLQILAWGDPLIPKPLKQLWRTGNLPTPDEVQAELDEAWGFNFYLPKSLLIVRFPPQFARWYVDDTVRHPTFEPITYQKLLQLIRQQVKGSQQQQLLSIIGQRPETDAYYKAWIRVGDINVLMRLRDWRPNGEVIAPLSVRQKLLEEALQEISNYQDF